MHNNITYYHHYPNKHGMVRGKPLRSIKRNTMRNIISNMSVSISNVSELEVSIGNLNVSFFHDISISGEEIRSDICSPWICPSWAIDMIGHGQGVWGSEHMTDVTMGDREKQATCTFYSFEWFTLWQTIKQGIHDMIFTAETRFGMGNRDDMSTMGF